MDHVLTDRIDRAEAVDAAEDIWLMMGRINRRDSKMAREFSRRHHSEFGEYEEMCPHPRSVYGNLKAALRALLGSLGMSDTDLDTAWQYLLDGDSVRDVVRSFGTVS
jgi:hypothetical protein